MKKNLKKVLTLVLALSMLALAGCGEKNEPVTAQSLMEDMNANVEAAESFSGALAMEMAMGISVQGISMDMDVALDGDYQAIVDPETIYMDTTMSMSLMGISVDMETYVQTEGDTVTTYTGMGGEWTKAEAPVSDEANMQEMYAMFGNGEDFVLAEETETFNEKEVYVLTAAVTGEKVQELLGQMSMEDLVNSYGEMDLSQLTADVNIKVYKDTVLPASVSVELTGEGMSTDADGTTVEINEFNMEMTYDAFDEVEEIVIPEEALAAELVE